MHMVGGMHVYMSMYSVACLDLCLTVMNDTYMFLHNVYFQL